MLKEPSQDGRPEAVVEHQREFAKLMQKERPDAKPGDIVTKPMRNVMRRLLASVFRGPDGREIKQSILDTYTGNVILRVNSTLSRQHRRTRPCRCQSCRACRRFPTRCSTASWVARLILLDPHGRLVVDIVEKVFP